MAALKPCAGNEAVHRTNPYGAGAGGPFKRSFGLSGAVPHPISPLLPHRHRAGRPLLGSSQVAGLIALLASLASTFPIYALGG